MRRSIPTLVVPDVHQNLPFLEAALEIGRLHRCGRVVLLGDLFDGRRRETSTPVALLATLERVRRLRAQPDLEVHVILGNHDFRYERAQDLLTEASRWDGSPGTPFANRCHDAQVLPENLRAIAHVGPNGRLAWDEQDWAAMEGPILVEGHLLSHAGVHPAFWPAGDASLEVKVETLAERWLAERAEALTGHLPPLFAAGAARGGWGPQGGPLWLDWSQEFVDELPCPQVVGHSAAAGVRAKGRSTCLDAIGTAVGILRNGRLQVVSVGTT